MFERLIDAQDGMACFGELLGGSNFSHLFNVAIKPHETPTPELLLDTRRQCYLMQFAEYMAQIASGKLYSGPIGRVDGTTLISGFPLKKLYGIFNLIADAASTDELDRIEQAIGAYLGVKLLGMQWKKSFHSAPDFLKKENAYWIEIVRDPYERLMSERLVGPGMKLVTVFERANDQLRFATEFRHPRYMIIKYEDLCLQTDRSLDRISEFLGERVKILPLRNLYGNYFYPNTAEHVLSGEHFTKQDPRRSFKLGSEDPYKWKDRIPPVFAAMISAAVDFRGLYEKRPISHDARIRAATKLAMLRARETARGAIVGLFDACGFTLVRKS
jgi:hypothetical protein